MENTGTLIVQVYTADQALPVSGANVKVTQLTDNGEELIRVMQTDRSGKTVPLLLPAPPSSNSQTPDGGVKFFNYNIRVDYPGYYTMENLNVPIFDGQTAIQPVALIPLAAGDEQGKKITSVEEEPLEAE